MKPEKWRTFPVQLSLHELINAKSIFNVNVNIKITGNNTVRQNDWQCGRLTQPVLLIFLSGLPYRFFFSFLFFWFDDSKHVSHEFQILSW